MNRFCFLPLIMGVYGSKNNVSLPISRYANIVASSVLSNGTDSYIMLGYYLKRIA